MIYIYIKIHGSILLSSSTTIMLKTCCWNHYRVLLSTAYMKFKVKKGKHKTEHLQFLYTVTG